jgi:type IX secretion system PorP/SprF family membrane protein
MRRVSALRSIKKPIIKYNKMKKTIIAFALLTSIGASAQQEAQYTQNQFNSMLMINPAYAGSQGGPSAALRYRNQWVGMPGSPKTVNFNGEMLIPNKKIGIGLSLTNDKLGVYSNTSADLSLGYHIQLTDKLKMSAGTKLGVDFVKSDFTALSGVDFSDPLYVNTSFAMPYVGVGGLLYNDMWYLGLSSPRVVSFEDASPQSKYGKPHLYAYSGVTIPISADWKVKPALMLKYQAQAPLQADIAADFWYANTVGLGVSYRTTDAVNLMLKTKLNKFNFGYSYDIGVSNNNNFHRGSHELYFGIDLGKKGGDPELNRQQNNRHF